MLSMILGRLPLPTNEPSVTHSPTETAAPSSRDWAWAVENCHKDPTLQLPTSLPPPDPTRQAPMQMLIQMRKRRQHWPFSAWLRWGTEISQHLLFETWSLEPIRLPCLVDDQIGMVCSPALWLPTLNHRLRLPSVVAVLRQLSLVLQPG